MNPINILITGSGAPGAPGIIKSLRNNGERQIFIVGVDINPENSGVSLVDKFFSIPKPTNNDFIYKILNISIKNNIQVILPLVTRELLVLSRNIEKFRRHTIHLAISSAKDLAIANNKAKLMTFLKEHSIPTPQFTVVNSLTEFKQAVRLLGYPDKRVCFKPPVSNGSRGFRIIDDSIDQMDLLLKYKPNTTFISYQNIIEILSKADNFPELVVMEYLPGDEYSIDLLVNHGKPLYTIPRFRHVIKAGISSVGSVIKNDEIIEYCNNIVENLKLHGNIGIQVKADENGQYKILEINPRVQGTIVLCTASGVNLPYLGIKLAMGESIPTDFDIRWGIKMFRFYDEVYMDENREFFKYD